MHKPFANEPPVDFTLEDSRRKMRDGLAGRARGVRPGIWPLVIGATSRRPANGSTRSTRPTPPRNRRTRGARHHRHRRRPPWMPPWQGRTRLARDPGGPAARPSSTKMAALMREERYRALRAGSLRGRQALGGGGRRSRRGHRLLRILRRRDAPVGRPQATFRVPGENSTQEYIPRGVGLVIAPWNFPLAILCGMTVAALVTRQHGHHEARRAVQHRGGRASWTSRCAPGLPPGVLNFLTGYGEEVGEFLVNHPKGGFHRVHGFQGSRPQDLGSRRQDPGGSGAAQARGLRDGRQERAHHRRGRRSRRSGARRAVFRVRLPGAEVLGPFAADRAGGLLRPVSGAAGRGDFQPQGRVRPRNRRSTWGRWSTTRRHERIRRVRRNRQGGGAAGLRGAASPAGDGYFVAPTVFAEVPPDARIAREEIFGPVLAVSQGEGPGRGIRWPTTPSCADGRDVFAQPGQHRAHQTRTHVVGNLYINRTITGAIVARHPFGGFKMSGGGTKAGGRDYLLNFVFPRVVTENVLRRGFAPVEEGQEEHQLAGAG